jgi:hypothetical protein
MYWTKYLDNFYKRVLSANQIKQLQRAANHTIPYIFPLLPVGRVTAGLPEVPITNVPSLLVAHNFCFVFNRWNPVLYNTIGL